MTTETKNKRAIHSELIAEQIEKEIVDGILCAGAKLDEAAIAARFGVSRTPVREAFMILVSRALAERVPYKGVIVCNLSFERIEGMFEAMSEIDGLCGRLAAGRMTAGEQAVLQDLHLSMAALAKAGHFEAYQSANWELHDLIHQGTHNSDLIEIARGMGVKLAPFRRAQLLNRERVEQSHEEHEEIVQALIERNSVTAERLLRMHLLSSARSYLTAFAARSKTAATGSDAFEGRRRARGRNRKLGAN
ncbi:GntR family transcriptional regulator [Roseibium aggregatum]|uniref:GntR family transcriptional regulator n=1 Tax=Roseibium aggregatum TaxID=187304 RepID=A0A939ECN2_9HYPH|nr:GntR family transcriptional regulator [Roseibium aggregatum]MBN9670159.1 GntR family transcriptional regulator [Roseibium aggregatum]